MKRYTLRSFLCENQHRDRISTPTSSSDRRIMCAHSSDSTAQDHAAGMTHTASSLILDCRVMRYFSLVFKLDNAQARLKI